MDHRSSERTQKSGALTIGARTGAAPKGWGFDGCGSEGVNWLDIIGYP